MLKKIYKNKGILFITDNNDNITFNNILINEYINHKDKNNVLASYAASFAHDDWKYSVKQTIDSKILLKNFSYISVRETHGVELIKKYLDNKSIRVLDPTFLLDASD